MAVELIIVFLIHAVIANELVPSNVVDIQSLIPSENPPLLAHNEEVTLINNQVPDNDYDNVIELHQEEPTPCHNTEVLVPILNQLLNLLMQDPSNFYKVSKISALLQEYLKNMSDGQNNNIKLANEETVVDKDTLRASYYDGFKGHVKTKIVFKYDLPGINQPQCKDVFMRLIKSAYEVYVQLAKNPLCKNDDIMETILKKPYAVPYNSLNNNLNPNLPSKKEEYSINDLIKQLQPEKDIHGHTQEPNNVDLANIYANYKPVFPNDHSQSNIGVLESNKRTPYDFNLNAYEYGKNPTALPLDVNYYRPERKDNSNYDESNIYNIFGNDKKEPIPQKEDSNILFPDTYNANLNGGNLKIPENNWKPINILMDSINGRIQHPVDSIISLPSATKTPDEKDGIQDNPMSLTYQPNYPNLDQNSAPNAHNVYSYLPNQDNKIVYQYGNPVGPTTQIPIQNPNVNIPYQKDITQYNPIYKYISNQYGIPNNVNTLKPYMQNVYNNNLNKLGILPNVQQIDSVPNAFKLDPTAKAGVIELTFVVKRTTPLIYQPLYFVKFKIPYPTFLQNIRNLLLTKPYLKINPLKLYQELITLSNVSDISSDLKGYKKEDILKLAYKNGELVTAKLIKDDNALNDQLRLIQSLNSGIGAGDILKLTNNNKVFLKTSYDKGNSSDVLGIGRYGNHMTPYYDLSSSGIGLNSEPLARYDGSQALPTNTAIRPVSFGSFEGNVMPPKYFLGGLASQKATLGTFSSGLKG